MIDCHRLLISSIVQVLNNSCCISAYPLSKYLWNNSHCISAYPISKYLWNNSHCISAYPLPVFSLNFSSAGKGPFMACKAKGGCPWCTFLEGRRGSAVRDMVPPLGAKFSETLFPHFKIYHKTPKIPPTCISPSKNKHPKLQNAKTPPVKSPLWAYTWKLSSNSKNKQTNKPKTVYSNTWICQKLLVYQVIAVCVVRSSPLA